MYVSIDMNSLRALHAHRVPGIVHDLVYLECADIDYVLVQDTSSDLFLDQLTGMELKKLYHNMTGGSAALWDDLAIRHALATLLGAATPTKVDHAELEAQCECAAKYRAEDARTILRYALGAKVPAQVNELFPLKTPPMPDWHDATARGVQRIHTPPPPVPHDPANRAPARPTAAPRAPGSSSRPRIFKVADEMWEAAGKPMDKDTVLALRKEMMQVLETEHSIKKTTSSTALGDWMKQRVK
jgi:hypothetical protein